MKTITRVEALNESKNFISLLVECGIEEEIAVSNTLDYFYTSYENERYESKNIVLDSEMTASEQIEEVMGW